MRYFFRRFAIVLVGVSLFGWFVPVHAAPVTTLSIKLAPTQAIQVGQVFDVQVLIEATEEINAVQGKIVFPSDLLVVRDISDGNSVINYWVERPHETPTGIAFVGIIPGGYQDKRGTLFTVRFQARKEGLTNVNLQGAIVLKNDGQGTPATFSIQPLSFTIVTATGTLPSVPTIVDTEPPEVFQPVITHDPNVFDGKWFVTFATQDKGSGIDHYEVKEESRPGEGTWQKAESPYLLTDQSLSQRVLVKAIDTSGNERIATIEPLHPAVPPAVPPVVTQYPKWWLFVILGVVIVLLYVLNTRRRMKSSV